MNIYIFGQNQLATIAAEICIENPSFEFCGFTSHVEHLKTNQKEALPACSFEDVCERHDPKETAIFVAVGYRDMRARQRLFEEVNTAGFIMPNLISKGALVSNSATLGSNNIIMGGAVIEQGVTLCDNNTVWSNATICHHSKLGSHNFLAANTTLGGEVTIGSRNFLGFSSVVEQHRTIGHENLIGSLSFLRSNIENNGTWLGIPAQHCGNHAKNGLQILDPENAKK